MVEAVRGYLNSIVQQMFPSAEPEGMSTAVWGLVHGLAFLHLDNKFDTTSQEAVAGTVRAAVYAVLRYSPAPAKATSRRR